MPPPGLFNSSRRVRDVRAHLLGDAIHVAVVEAAVVRLPPQDSGEGGVVERPLEDGRAAVARRGIRVDLVLAEDADLGVLVEDVDARRRYAPVRPSARAADFVEVDADGWIRQRAVVAQLSVDDDRAGVAQPRAADGGRGHDALAAAEDRK